MSYSFLKYFIVQSTHKSSIKQCVLVIGHWFFFRDKSLSSNRIENEEVTTYFREITGSIHNSNPKFVPDFYSTLLIESEQSFYVKQCLDTVLLDHQIFSSCLENDEELMPFVKGNFDNWTKTTKIAKTKVTINDHAKQLRFHNTFDENMAFFWIC